MAGGRGRWQWQVHVQRQVQRQVHVQRQRQVADGRWQRQVHIVHSQYWFTKSREFIIVPFLLIKFAVID